jgi:hypothetical protein
MSNQEKQSLTVLVWERCPSKYSGTALVLLLKLAGLSSRDGHAWPGMDRLASMCGVTSRALRYIVKDLKKDGVLKTQSRKGHSNRFFLQVDEIEKLATIVPPRVPETQAPAAPEAQPRDGRHIAQRLANALRAANPAAIVPLDLTAWAAQLQNLIAAGNQYEIVCKALKFSRSHEWWASEIAKSDPVTVLVKNFELILRQLNKAEERKVAA